jgi:Mg2+ and Co2+ transporter CorA
MDNFNQILKALDNKADKFEIQNYNPGMDSDMGGKVHKLAAECNDMERKVEDIERTLQRLVKDQDTELENLRQQLMSSIQTKADFRDLDSML